MSGSSSFMSMNFKACAFSTSLGGTGGKAEASLNGVAFSTVAADVETFTVDSNCVRLPLKAVVKSGGWRGVGTPVDGAPEESSGRKLMEDDGGRISMERGWGHIICGRGLPRPAF